MQEPIGQRLKFTRERLGYSQEAFAEALHVGRSQLSEIERGKKNLTEDACSALIETFGVSLDWLFTGRGPTQTGKDSEGKVMVSPTIETTGTFTEEGNTKQGNTRVTATPKTTGTYLAEESPPYGTRRADVERLSSLPGLTRVPVVSQRAYAGQPGGWSDVDPDTSEDYLALPGLRTTRPLIAVRVFGDSMSPTVEESDLLVCRLLDSLDELPSGGAAVLCVRDDGATIKRVLRDIEAAFIQLVPDNPAHATRRLALKEVVQLWEPVLRITPVLLNPLSGQLSALQSILFTLDNRLQRIESGSNPAHLRASIA
jgi:transcriptional regulator with XRE-family HTH domain